MLWNDAPGMTNTLQRTWSNADAAAGTDPCVGDGTVPYYQTIPVAPDADTIDVPFVGTVTTHLDKIAVGSSGTVVMYRLLSRATPASSGPFSVTAVDMSGSGQPPALTITSPTGTFNTGDAVTFQVTVNSGGSVVSANAGALRGHHVARRHRLRAGDALLRADRTVGGLRGQSDSVNSIDGCDPANVSHAPSVRLLVSPVVPSLATHLGAGRRSRR